MSPSRSDKSSAAPKRIAYQGEPGANSHLACTEAFPDMEPAAYPTFEDALVGGEVGRGRPCHDPDREFGRRPRR